MNTKAVSGQGHAACVRQPVAAGTLYPAESESLRAQVARYVQAGAALRAGSTTVAGPADTAGPLRPWGVMLPHAGYVYSGTVAGAGLAGVSLPSTVLVLCPNHTGRGPALSVWPHGLWDFPTGAVSVDAELAAWLVAQGDGLYAADYTAHLAEHSIEVLVPFLQAVTATATDATAEAGQSLRIIPVCVGTQQAQTLRAAGQILARCLGQWQEAGRQVGLIISSDMNHFESQPRTIEKDALALDRVLACDADGLLQVVARERITMCGAGPLALALYAVHTLGRPQAALVAHDTSARASSDMQRVVGYAAVHIFV